MNTGYRGRCPVCSGELKAGSSIIQCENGDYEATMTDYEGRWEEYDAALLILTEVLLEDLKSYNKKSIDRNKNENYNG